jgi:uncharacterized protein YecT (DUF1311 family)
MKTVLSLFVGIAFCLGALQIFAQGADPKAPVGTTPRILADIEAARKEAEKKLERALQKSVHAIEKSENIGRGRAALVVGDLKASQAAWQEYREKQCGFLYSYYYEEIGSLGARAAGMWQYEHGLIEERIKELENPPGYF